MYTSYGQRYHRAMCVCVWLRKRAGVREREREREEGRKGGIEERKKGEKKGEWVCSETKIGRRRIGMKLIREPCDVFGGFVRTGG